MLRTVLGARSRAVDNNGGQSSNGRQMSSRFSTSRIQSGSSLLGVGGEGGGGGGGDSLIRLQHGVFDCALMGLVTELLLWRRPGTAISILIAGTVAYSYVVVCKCTLLKLVADAALLLVSALGVMGLLSQLYDFRPPVDPLDWQISAESAEFVAALLANMFGATEGVLRVAASGLDRRLFVKVMLALYGLSVLGKLVSTATIVYILMWLLFTLPILCAKYRPEGVERRWGWRGSESWSDGESSSAMAEPVSGSDSGAE